jgi:hypothetical protein
MELCERFCHFASAAALHTLKIAALPGRFVVFRVNIGHVPQPAEVSSSMAEPILSAAGEPRARPILTMIAVGTIVPFLLLVGAPSSQSATRVAVTAMSSRSRELWWPTHGSARSFTGRKWMGGARVLAGILLA